MNDPQWIQWLNRDELVPGIIRLVLFVIAFFTMLFGGWALAV